MKLTCNPAAMVGAEIILPASKSEVNRALMLEAYSGKKGWVQYADLADDSLLMQQILSEIEAGNTALNIRDAGTVGRFILPLLCMMPGDWMVNGEGRMLQRPYGDLLKALRLLGGKIECTEREGYLPVKISGGNLSGGTVQIGGSDSSQFISALMLAGPFLNGGIQIIIRGKAVSFSYLRLTAKVLRAWGAAVKITEQEIVVQEGFQQSPLEKYKAEADWSSATYWLAALCLLPTGSRFHFPGLNEASEQGDRRFMEILSPFGLDFLFENGGLSAANLQVIELPCLEVNMSAMPDAVPTLAVLCALKAIPARFIGIEHLRHKESNRLTALQLELAKINCVFLQTPEGWDLKPGARPNKPSAPIEVYHDHRMAMSFALLSLVFPELELNTAPEVSAKSFPGFFTQWQKAGMANITM